MADSKTSYFRTPSPSTESHPGTLCAPTLLDHPLCAGYFRQIFSLNPPKDPVVLGIVLLMTHVRLLQEEYLTQSHTTIKQKGSPLNPKLLFSKPHCLPRRKFCASAPCRARRGFLSHPVSIPRLPLSVTCMGALPNCCPHRPVEQDATFDVLPEGSL